jgi:hypothetical protein
VIFHAANGTTLPSAVNPRALDDDDLKPLWEGEVK